MSRFCPQAEAIGTGLITLLGTGTVCAAVFTGAQAGLWQIAAAWGAAVALAAYTTASVSGAHLNPAVTFALVVFKGFPPGRALAYVLAQVAGATGAALLNLLAYSKAISSFEARKSIVRGAAASIASAPGVMSFGAHGITAPGAFALEALQMAVLMFVILSVTHEESAAASSGACALIGLTVAALISVYGRAPHACHRVATTRRHTRAFASDSCPCPGTAAHRADGAAMLCPSVSVQRSRWRASTRHATWGRASSPPPPAGAASPSRASRATWWARSLARSLARSCTARPTRDRKTDASGGKTGTRVAGGREVSCGFNRD